MIPVDVLVSYALDQSASGIANMRRAIGSESFMVLDSGAFTAFTTGKKLTLEGYMAHLENCSGSYDRAITLDVVNDAEATRRNTEALWSEGFPVTPVLTIGESPARLRAWADSGVTFAAVGGVVPLRKSPRLLEGYLREVSKVAQDCGIALHGLGVGSIPKIRRYLYSGDFSFPVGKYAKLLVWHPHRKVLQQVSVRSRKEVLEHLDWLIGLGLPIDRMLSGSAFTFNVKDLQIASYWSCVVAGMWLRSHRRSGFVDLPEKAGPRLVLSASTKDKELLQVAESARTGDIPSVVSRYEKQYARAGRTSAKQGSD